LKRLTMFLLILILSMTLCTAAYADQSRLTYQQAVDMALTSSKTLKNAAADVDRTYEVRKDASSEGMIIPMEPGDPGVVKTYMGSMKADLYWQMSKKTLEIARDKIGYTVKQAYNTVLLAGEKKKVADLAVENHYWKNRLAELKYQNGMVSSIEHMQANSDYSGARESQKAAAKGLDDAYQKFNSLVGLSSDARPILTEVPQFAKLGDIDLEKRVSQVTSDNYNVWLDDQKTNLAKLDLDLYSSRTASEPYSAKQIDVTKAQNTADDSRTNIAKLVRTIYYSLKQLEDTYSTLQAKLTVADQAFKITQVKFDIGMATKAEVVSAQYDLEQLRLQVMEYGLNHDNQQMLFEKPWVY